jgi:amidase
VLCLPTSPSPAPLKGLPLPDTDRFRARAILFTCVAGLAGLPQVSLPLGKVDGAPVGLSLIARPGADEMLLELAEKIGR